MRKAEHREVFYMDEANVDNLKKALVGHSIKKVGSDYIVLDDDSTLSIEDSDECCSHYSGIFDSDGNVTDNVITDVVLNDHIQVYDDEAFRIVVMAEDKRLVELSVVGNEGSGCYVKSVYFTLSKAKPRATGKALSWRDLGISELKHFKELKNHTLVGIREKPHEEVSF